MLRKMNLDTFFYRKSVRIRFCGDFATNIGRLKSQYLAHSSKSLFLFILVINLELWSKKESLLNPNFPGRPNLLDAG